MGTGDPSSDTPRESQAKFKGGIVCKGPVGTGPLGQYSGSIRESRSTRLGWLNEVKVQVRDLVRVLILLPTLPNGDQYSEKVCIIEKPGVQD